MSLGGQKVLMIYFLIILTFAYLCSPSAAATNLPSIIASPNSKNVSLNGTASFNCSALNVANIFWQVNYSSIDKIPDLDDSYDYRTVGNVSTSKLEIKLYQDSKISILNNSAITCMGYGFPEGNAVRFTGSSTPARLSIQGRPDAPFNVHSRYGNSTFVVTWLPPFTLEGVQVNYSINITQQSENGPETIVDEQVTAKDEVSIFYVDSSNCTSYTTCVTAKTEAGGGQPGCTQVTREADDIQSSLCSGSQGYRAMQASSTIALMCVMTLFYLL